MLSWGMLNVAVDDNLCECGVCDVECRVVSTCMLWQQNLYSLDFGYNNMQLVAMLYCNTNENGCYVWLMLWVFVVTCLLLASSGLCRKGRGTARVPLAFTGFYYCKPGCGTPFRHPRLYHPTHIKYLDKLCEALMFWLASRTLSTTCCDV